MIGGLDYLKAVVIDDKLGIAEELDQQMAHIVSTYQDEWKTTIEDPEKVARFKHFINDDAADPDLQYKRERGQRVPVLATEGEGFLLRFAGKILLTPQTLTWTRVCELSQILPDTGVGAG